MTGRFFAQVALSAIMPFRPVQCPPGFEAICDDPWLRLFVQTGASCHLSEHGVIVGNIYSKDRMAPVTNLSPETWLDMVEDDGHGLIKRYWGSYVAFLRKLAPDGRMKISVLRAPFGTLHCYWHRVGDKLSLAASPELIAGSGLMKVSIDRLTLARHIAQPEIATSQTCLSDLYSLEGGTRLTATLPGPEIHQIWTPWQFCDDDNAVKDHAGAATLLRDTLIRSVAAQVSDYPSVLLLLSGGFDSSILAACLRHADREIHALNLVTETAKGDERHFAQIAAQATGAILTEAYRDLGLIDLTVSHAARAARPYARAFTQESEHQAATCARQADAGAVVDGGGGDNLFFNYLSLAAMVEVLSKSGPGLRFWRTSAAFADLAAVSHWRVIMRTLDRALRRGNRLRFEPRNTYLSKSFRTAITEQPAHPWHIPPGDISPGKAAHIALLAPAQAAAEQGSGTCLGLPWLSPLVCQPVIETVLSLPLWCWFAPGLNRAAARIAFEEDLPPALIKRRTKGTPAPFVNQMLEAHRPTIRELLLEGRLANLGILDTEILRKTLDDAAPARDLEFARVMELVDAEAWARSWD